MITSTPVNILLVEDNEADVRLITEHFKEIARPNHVYAVDDGEAVLPFLRQEGPYAEAPRPDLIILDLNVPRMDGQEVLAAVKTDENLKCIPIVVLTACEADTEVDQAYHHYANCYICKPLNFQAIQRILDGIVRFWLELVQLPPHPGGPEQSSGDKASCRSSVG